MPAAKPQPARDLFNQAIPVQRGDDVSDRAFRRRYIPKTYGTREIAEARRVIAHWNKHFQGTPGGYRANRNDACNVKAYARFLRHCQESKGDFPFTEKEVCLAITRYRQAATNIRLRAWKRFRDWIDVENVDRYLGDARVSQHAVDQAAKAKAEAAKRKAWALKIIRHRGVVDAAVRAAKAGSSLDAMCQKTQREAEASGNVKAHDWCARTRGYMATLRALPPERQAEFASRAEDVYEAAYDKAPGCELEAPARLYAIQLVLLDFGIQRNKRQQVGESE